MQEYSYETFKKAVKNIIKTSKFLPKISELVEECENSKEQARFEILEYMNAMGYFKESGYAISEYEKAIKWLETGIIPKWFKDDMTKYYKMMKHKYYSLPECILVSAINFHNHNVKATRFDILYHRCMGIDIQMEDLVEYKNIEQLTLNV